MLRADAEARLEMAAEKTWQRIEADLEGAGRLVKPLLRYIRDHLFEAGLSYERLREACGIRDNNRSTIFRQQVGLTPAAYIRDCRLEVACRLLRETELDAAAIGDLLGYRGQNVFGAAFRRWAGITPLRFRKQQEELGNAGQVALPENRPELNPAAWRRFLEGDLDDRQADLLFRYFLDRYPASRRRLLSELLRHVQLDNAGEGAGERIGSAPSLRSLFAREDIERLMAEVVWDDIRDKPWSELVDLVRHHLRFTTRALFDLLGEKSREEGRADRARGVVIARLAVEAAETIEGDEPDAEGRSRLKALAWAWLGNAKRLALDFSGADQAFRAARQRLPEGANAEAGEVLMLLATLRRWQRRHAEALELAETAVKHLAGGARGELLARTYLVLGIVRRELGDFGAAARHNAAAAELLDRKLEARLYFAARFNQARCLVDAGSPHAAEAVALARELAGSGQAAMNRVVWLEGLLARTEDRPDEALARFREAKDGLAAEGRVELVAVLDLDVALAALALGRYDEARQAVAEAIPIFESLAGSESERILAAAIRVEAGAVAEGLAALLERGLSARGIEALARAAERVTG